MRGSESMTIRAGHNALSHTQRNANTTAILFALLIAMSIGITTFFWGRGGGLRGLTKVFLKGSWFKMNEDRVLDAPLPPPPQGYVLPPALEVLRRTKRHLPLIHREAWPFWHGGSQEAHSG